MYHSILNVKPHCGPLQKRSVLLDDVGNAMSVGKQVRVNVVQGSSLPEGFSPLSRPEAPSCEVPAVIGKLLYHPTKQIAKRSVARANFNDCMHDISEPSNA